jgi:protein SCO1
MMLPRECNQSSNWILAPVLGLVLLGILGPGHAAAQPQNVPPQLENVGVDEKIGDQVDLNLTFTAENGHQVALKEYFHQKRPVILNLVYYNCPMLCNLVLNGQIGALREIPWTPGNEFEIVTVSIDPMETFSLAQKKKEMYLTSYGKPAPGWHFLTDYRGNVRKLAEQVGFGYQYDQATRQYAHAAVLMVLTEDGKVSRYLYGIKPKPRDVRLAISEAAEFKFAFTAEKILLFCFHYDPDSQSYAPVAINIMRLGGIITVLILVTIVFRQWRRERAVSTARTLART